MRSKSAAVAVSVFAVLVTALMAQSEPPPTADAPVPLRIAKDTTFILTPLRSDGTPDYLAAYNARLPQIPPSKNAFMYIFRATGPLFDPHAQKEMLAFLHLAPFPANAHFLQPLFQFEESLKAGKTSPETAPASAANLPTQEDLSQHLLAPADQPLITQWLNAQAQPMKLLEKAAALRVCAIPLCAKNGDDAIIDALPVIPGLFNCPAPFCARANLRAATGDFAGAQNDLVTALRLSRLIQQTPLLINRLIGTTTEWHVCQTARTIALSVPMTAGQLRSLAQALAAVPPPPTLAQTYDMGERFTTLDFYTQFARGKAARLRRLDLMIFNDSPLNDQGDLNLVDWNVLLRSVNQNFDKSTTIFSSTDWRAIRLALQKEAATQSAPKDVPVFPADSIYLPPPEKIGRATQWKNERQAILAWIHKRPNETREQFTTRIQQLFAGPKSLNNHFVNLLIARAPQFPLTQTTLALAAYHADHHVYPDSLAALVPHYLPALPQDPFSDGPLVYHPAPDGFKLYSIGPNAKDDGGNNDREKSQDDIAVIWPLPTPATHPATPR